MSQRHGTRLPPVRLLAMLALVLGACAAPAAVPPTAAPTEPATATALPPTAAATAQSTPAALANAAVPATSVTLTPYYLAFDADGNLYVSQCDPPPQIFKVDGFGQLTVYAGTPGGGFSGDGGPAAAAEMGCPEGLAFDRDGNLYVADLSNNRIRKIDRNGVIHTVAGSGPTDATPSGDSGDGGPATAAQLNRPNAIAFDPDGNLYRI